MLTADGPADSGMTTSEARGLRSLRGHRGWLISDGKAGSNRVVEGTAAALGLDAELKTVDPTGVFKLLAPFGPVDPGERFGKPGSRFAAPWPEIAIAIGRRSAPYVRALKASAPTCFTVYMLDPKAGRGVADAIWVPDHDRLRGGNVFTTPTSPHPFTQARLSELRADMPADIARLPQPRFAVLLGGRNGSYAFTDQVHARFAKALAAIRESGASFLITPSRRTHNELLGAALISTKGAERLVLGSDGPNRYPEFLAHADAFVVTADSVNMVGEAAATGKPVFVFTPPGGRAKFHRFHEGLRNYGATRPLPERLEKFEPWSYQPIDATAAIAYEIQVRWRHWRAGAGTAGIGLSSSLRRSESQQ